MFCKDSHDILRLARVEMDYLYYIQIHTHTPCHNLVVKEKNHLSCQVQQHFQFWTIILPFRNLRDSNTVPLKYNLKFNMTVHTQDVHVEFELLFCNTEYILPLPKRPRKEGKAWLNYSSIISWSLEFGLHMTCQTLLHAT